jgi:hypothetical protein
VALYAHARTRPDKNTTAGETRRPPKTPLMVHPFEDTRTAPISPGRAFPHSPLQKPPKRGSTETCQAWKPRPMAKQPGYPNPQLDGIGDRQKSRRLDSQRRPDVWLSRLPFHRYGFRP